MQLKSAGYNFIKDVFTELKQLFWAGMQKKGLCDCYSVIFKATEKYIC